MLRAKFFAAVAVLALAGAVYAGGNVQESAPQTAQAAKASCCAAHGAQHKDGHKGEGHHAAAACDKDGEGCCGSGSCCAGGSCEKEKKGEAAAVKVGAWADGEKSCCAPGAACCQRAANGHEGESCCAAHKKEGAHAASASAAATKQGESCCAGSGGACCTAHKKAGH